MCDATVAPWKPASALFFEFYFPPGFEGVKIFSVAY